jgi:hypothetical protein
VSSESDVPSQCVRSRAQSGSDGYGRPPPGSLSEQRAIKAAQWVDQEIDKLVGVIMYVRPPRCFTPRPTGHLSRAPNPLPWWRGRDMGTVDAQGRPMATFKALFLAYESISDTLVSRGEGPFHTIPQHRHVCGSASWGAWLGGCCAGGHPDARQEEAQDRV